MYDFSSGFGVINNAFANIAKQNELAYKQRTLAELGKDISSGNYASAAQKAIASGDATLGVSLLGLGQKAGDRAADAELVRGLMGGAGATATAVPMPRLGQSGYTPTPTIATSEAEVQALEGSTGTPGQKVAARLVNNGLTPTQAAGVASNLNAESRFRTDARNPGDGRDGSDSVGMAQWNGPRAQALQQFAAQQGKDWRDPNVQADFVAYELRTTEGRAGAALENAQTPQQAGAAAIGYFRPQGYTASNPMGALSAGQRVGGANQFVLGGEVAPPSGAFTPPQTQVAQAPAQPGQPIADVPAQGAQPAQGFVIPGTGQVVDQQTLASNPRIRNLIGALGAARTESAKATIGKLLDVELADAKAKQAQSAPTDVQRNYNEAKRQGYTGTLLDYQKELRAQNTVNVDTKGEGKYAETVGKALGERMDAVSKEGDTARADMILIGQLRDLGGQIKNMGAGAALQARLSEFGIKVGENVSEIEAYKSIVDKLTPQQRVPGTGASSDLDVKMFKSSLPALVNTPGGNALILDTLEAVAADKAARAAIADRALVGELKPQEALKAFRELPDPMAKFKEARKSGFKADATAPAAVPTPATADGWQDLGGGVRIREKR